MHKNLFHQHLLIGCLCFFIGWFESPDPRHFSWNGVVVSICTDLSHACGGAGHLADEP
jgi:hypothetical protein